MKSKIFTKIFTKVFLYHFFLSASISFYMKHLFMLSISSKSYLIRHSFTGRVFKDTQRAFGDLRHLNSTRALGHSKGTHALEGHWSIRTLGYLGQWGNRALRHSGNWALGALKDLGNRALGYLRHSSFLALGHLSLVFIWNSALRERGDSIITLRPGG